MIANADSRWDNINVRSLRIAEKLLLRSHDVTGKVQPNFNKRYKLGKWLLLHSLSDVANFDDLLSSFWTNQCHYYRQFHNLEDLFCIHWR